MGSAFTTLGGDPVPSVDDQVLIPADILMYAEAIGHKIVHWVVDQAERDTVYAAAEAPCWVASPSALWLKISGSGGTSVWRIIWQDSGPVSAGIVPATNFVYSSGYVRKINNVVFFTLTMTRKNSALTTNAYNVGAPGNISGDPPIFTLPAGYWPDHEVKATWSSGGVSNGVADVTSGGVVELSSGIPTVTIGIDDQVTVTGMFMVP
jgi:hypothetical protein